MKSMKIKINFRFEPKVIEIQDGTYEIEDVISHENRITLLRTKEHIRYCESLSEGTLMITLVFSNYLNFHYF